MKINCQSCEAKYTIADDKVRGKTVKIRCKKCGAAIVVKGNEQAPEHGYEEEEDDATRVYPHAGAQASSVTSAMDWTLNMPDGDQRAVSVEEIGQLFATGAINAETYAWRDGMGDWLPLGQIVELAPVLSPQAAAAPRPSTSPSPDPRLAGVFGGESGGQARVAARRQERARDQDLFGGARQAGSDEEVAARAAAAPAAAPAPKHTFTAERGENSVLFSVEAIRATAKPVTKAPPANDDKVDFNALASNIPPPMDAPVGSYDEVLNSPPSFPSFGGPMLAAPMLPTSIEPEPMPQPDPAVAAAADMPMPTKSNKGLVIGLVAAVALLGVISLAFGGYVMFYRSAPADTASAATSTAPATRAPAPDTTDSAGAAADAAPEEPKAGDTADAAATEPTAATTSTKTEIPKGPLPESTKPDPTKKDDTKKDAKKDEPKEAPPPTADTAAPAPAGGAPFSRGAAVSALNSAAGAASGCKKPDGPTGRGRVSVTFAPSGRVTSAVVNGPPFAGTSVGGCVAAAFRRASVPPFTGSPVTVHKSFSVQ